MFEPVFEPVTESPSNLRWRKLHKLSPFVSDGQIVTAVTAATVEVVRGHGSALEFVAVATGILAIVFVANYVRYIRTRWCLDGATLRINTGLIRHDHRQLPLTRMQSVDVIRPLIARAAGLAELRIRLAGAGANKARLAYLAEADALELRAQLLAGNHGLALATPEPGEAVAATVPGSRLVMSILLSPGALVLAVIICGTVGALLYSPEVGLPVLGTTTTLIIVIAQQVWGKITAEFSFTVAAAGDGVRIRRGLLATVAETIPLQRIQAVRMIEPLSWRPTGWCRLELDLAGTAGSEAGSRSLTMALLPVGSHETAWALLYGLLGIYPVEMSPPPPASRAKTLLSFHFLSCAVNERFAVASAGRIQKVTTWVPMDKVQSIRHVQGPVQRRLGLATVCVDAAGRGIVAKLRDRETEEANQLFGYVIATSRQARRVSTAASPSGS